MGIIEESDDGTSKRIVPLLPLRDIVIFPHMIVPLFVGREKSVRALEDEFDYILLDQPPNPDASANTSHDPFAEAVVRDRLGGEHRPRRSHRGRRRLGQRRAELPAVQRRYELAPGRRGGVRLRALVPDSAR